MNNKLATGICLLSLLLPLALRAEHQLAGAEIINLKFDTTNGRMSFSLVNTTDKWITAWAWTVLNSGSDEGSGIRWYDNYATVDLPGVTSTWPVSASRIRPGEFREISDPLPENAKDVSLVAVIFEDTTAYGDPSVLDNLEKSRQIDITVEEAVLSEIASIRASSNPADALRQSIERTSRAPQSKSQKGTLLRARLERLRSNLKFTNPHGVLFEADEMIAQAQLERAKAQAHLRRMK